MHAAVTGGGGRLGCSLVRALLQGGHSVRVLEPGAAMPASLAGLDVELVRGSVLSADDVARLVDGVQVVFHLAAKVNLDKDTLASRFSGKPPLFTPGVLRASVSNTMVSHAKAERELGFAPRATRESLSDALAFYREQGWLEQKLAA